MSNDLLHIPTLANTNYLETAKSKIKFFNQCPEKRKIDPNPNTHKRDYECECVENEFSKKINILAQRFPNGGRRHAAEYRGAPQNNSNRVRCL